MTRHDAAIHWALSLPPDDYAQMTAELVGLTGDKHAAAVAAWRSTAAVHTDPELLAALSSDSDSDAEQAPAPHRDGYTIGVYLPPQTPATVRNQLFDTIAEAAGAAEDGWDAYVVGLPGDPLGAVDGEARP